MCKEMLLVVVVDVAVVLIKCCYTKVSPTCLLMNVQEEESVACALKIYISSFLKR